MVVQQSPYDSLTAEDLAGTLGVKWTMFPDCIGAFIAEMDYGSSPAIKEDLRKAVDAGFFGYLPKAKEQELAEACAGWYHRHTSWAVDASQIHSMPDVLKGLELTLRYYAPKGGKVILPTPAYMPFLMIPGRFNREIIEVPMLKTGYGWEYDFDGIEKAFQDGGEVLIVCNPHNPIGKVARRDEMEKLAEIVDRHDGRVFSDEIHAPLVFRGGEHVPYASISETAAGHTVTAVAASKAWNLAGLKCAQVIITNDADQAIWEDGAWWAAHGASTLGVVASIAAFEKSEEWLDDVIEYLDGNRQRLAELVAEHLPGVTYVQPEGTYLAWLDFSATKVPVDVATFFRDEARVAITDGSACGQVGEKGVRFNFSMSRPMLEQTLCAMGNALRSLDKA
jgi:cysteine-S-conjugate beta-lyase